MPADSIITVENLSKRYLVGHSDRESYSSLRDAISRTFMHFVRTAYDVVAGRQIVQGDSIEEFWALKDVSFDVKKGEVLGVIGRNGAGKSTLLKVLSRITEPTRGRVGIRGRIASLLEVGTGFHPELTGRENIFLNGAILGMPRSDIRRKFDEIVSFAEVEKFLDTPVKRYSSGMYVRLAFAVAAHLEPEILIVDEVLAVGDMEFQKKCLGKMDDVAKGGRTVLFVSHNMAAISALSTTGLLLQSGRCVFNGPIEEAIDRYLSMGHSLGAETTFPSSLAVEGSAAIPLAARVISEGKVSGEVLLSKETLIEVDYEVLRTDASIAISIHLIDTMGTIIFASANFPSASLAPDPLYDLRKTGRRRTTMTIPGNFLNEGLYRIHIFVVSNGTKIECSLQEALAFHTHDDGEMRKEYTSQWIGLIRPRLSWHSVEL